eukprot:350290-Chlamydomonas_euryale.AAC.2
MSTVVGAGAPDTDGISSGCSSPLATRAETARRGARTGAAVREEGRTRTTAAAGAQRGAAAAVRVERQVLDMAMLVKELSERL